MPTGADFRAIAEAVNDARKALPDADATGHDNRQTQVMDAMVKDIAARLARMNPRFDRQKFLDGCGVKQ
jgi:hypothetical protein